MAGSGFAVSVKLVDLANGPLAAVPRPRAERLRRVESRYSLPGIRIVERGHRVTPFFSPLVLLMAADPPQHVKLSEPDAAFVFAPEALTPLADVFVELRPMGRS